ncbi:RND transporter [Pseudonocardia spinosispora]|uniref:RND transporter n=1 Tax=Pseudonocardia spinosispora TaxID=103441 RepID=UPI001FDF1DCD|nr:RND transporter [Pseudonocardia spinosispora]
MDKRALIAALAVAVALAAVTVLGLVRLKADTTVSSFLPAGDPALRATEEAAKRFGGDPIVILAESAEPRELLGREQLPKLLDLEGKLAKLPDVSVVYGAGTVLNQMAGSAQNLLATISGSRDATKATAEADALAGGASQEAVTAAGVAAVAAFDQRYAALLVRGLPAGLPTLRNPGFVNALVFDQSGAPRAQWKFVIPAQNAVSILVRPREGLDQNGTQALVHAARTAVEQSGLKTSRLTFSGSPAVAAELGDTVQREIPLLGALAVLLIAACYLLVSWTARRVHRLLPLVSTLGATAVTLSVFGWLDRPLSLGVITFLPIVIGIGSDFPAYLMHGGMPRRRVLIVALASALGFASLALSPLPFVRDLGLALAVGVLLAVGLALALRRFFVTTPTEEPARAAEEQTRPALPRRKRITVLCGALAVAAVGWLVLPSIPIEARPDRLAAGLASMDDAAHVEDVLGSSGEVEIMLRGATDGAVATPEALAWMRKAEDSVVLDHGGDLRPIVSLPDLLRFLGPSPTQDQLNSALSLLPHYLTASVLSDDGKQAVISLGLSLQDLGGQRALLDSMRAGLPPPPAGMTVDVVGLPVAAARGFELVSQGRYLTNLVGIAAAGLVLLLGLRSRRVAGRAVLAAGLATGWGLAGIWVLGIDLSPLSVALGSLTTATACEFTVLLGYASGAGVARLRRTVLVAALAASLGYLALAVSTLSVIRDFGLLLAATVGLSLLAAHLVVRMLPEPAPVAEPEHVTPKTSLETV